MFLPDEVVHAALDALLAGGPNRWLGLSTTEPVLVGGVYTNITEPTAASYARTSVPAPDWPAAADRAAQVEVVIPDPVDDLGVAVAWVLFDSAAGGTADLAGVPDEPVELLAGSSNVTITCRVEAPADLITL